MNHAYRVKAIVPLNGSITRLMYAESYTVIAPNAAKACHKAISQAKRRSGYRGNRWRIVELAEHVEPL